MATKTKIKKSKLKYITQTVHSIEYGDLEQFVQEHYDPHYSFVATEECGNDSQHTFHIKREKHDEYEQEYLDKVRKGKVPNYGNHYVMQVLAEDGHIPFGRYIVRVCW